MVVSLPSWAFAQQADQRSVGFTPKIMVYEDVPIEPARWEYRVLTVDTREKSLPDVDLLNKLGDEGWFLVEVLPQNKGDEGALVYYYFARQVTEKKERS